MKRYYVTGGLGVIGSAFAEEMLKQGNHVTIIDSAEEKRNHWMAEYLKNKYDNLIIHKERLETAYLEDLKDHDFIFHAAAHTGIPHSVIDPQDDWLSNVEATRNILEKLRELNKKIPMVALSSVKPYKVDHLPYEETIMKYYWKDSKGISENQVLEPDEPYAASKMAQSGLCMAYARSYDLPVMVFRCSNLFGAAPSHGPRHGWLTWFCLSAVLERPIDIQGSGKQVRDMLYSSDVISAAMAAYDNMDKVKGNVYNIGGGIDNSLSIREAANKVENCYGKILYTYSEGRKHEDPIFITDFSKFNKATGWEPKVSVKQGISNIINWAKENKSEVQKIYDWLK